MLDEETVAVIKKLTKRIRALKRALRPFARFDVQPSFRRQGYNDTVYATQVKPGKPATELTVDDFDNARKAYKETP